MCRRPPLLPAAAVAGHGIPTVPGHHASRLIIT